jgi:hypothetical protein
VRELSQRQSAFESNAKVIQPDGDSYRGSSIARRSRAKVQAQ